jgi:hypothetical protein
MQLLTRCNKLLNQAFDYTFDELLYCTTVVKEVFTNPGTWIIFVYNLYRAIRCWLKLKKYLPCVRIVFILIKIKCVLFRASSANSSKNKNRKKKTKNADIKKFLRNGVLLLFSCSRIMDTAVASSLLHICHRSLIKKYSYINSVVDL